MDSEVGPKKALRGDGEFPDGYTGSRTVQQMTALFDACFRIQREASETATLAYGCANCGVYHPATRLDGCTFTPRYIPMVVENVKGAQPWVGRAKANYGSFYLWGDVESVGGRIVAAHQVAFGAASVKAFRASKTVGHVNIRDGHTHTRHQRESDALKVPGMNFHEHEKTGKPGRSFQSAAVATMDGTKQPGLSGPAWFDGGAAHLSSKSSARKAASAQIAKIPYELSAYIARCFKPETAEAVA